jgi:hypothetical protein
MPFLGKLAELREAASTRESFDANSNTVYKSAREHLEGIRGWLDLCLHQLLARESSSEDDTSASTPGWAMSAKRARTVLGGTFASASVEHLQRARDGLKTEIEARASASRSSDCVPQLLALFDAFGLDDVEQQILAFAISPELDGRYARVFGYLNDDLTRRRPTPSILAQLLEPEGRIGWDVRELLAGEGPLATYQLVILDPSDPGPASEAGMIPAPDLISYLLAEPDRLPRYGPHLQVIPRSQSTNVDNDPSTWTLTKKLAAWREASEADKRVPIIQLIGDNTTLRWFSRVAQGDGNSIVIFDVSAIADQSVAGTLESVLSAARVAVLHHSVLLVTGLDQLEKNIRREQIETQLVTRLRSCGGRIVVHGGAPWLLPAGDNVWQVERVYPSVATRAGLWRKHAGRIGLDLAGQDARMLAATVRFDETEIDATLQLCSRNMGTLLTLKDIQAAARRVALTSVPSMAQRVDATFSWDDIVLPEPVVALLRQIPVHVRHAGDVFEDWGYGARMPYGRGVAALFTGPSGTGKTMAAQIIARELGVELFQVDLAKAVSKYIGETEKNLGRIFDSAERASAVLLFDEADALFGKRSEVKDAHDRYANVEIAYLLQRMETYSGLAVLTTNLKQNIDNAFLRRLRFVIDFPSPDAAHREQIWQRVFPADAPLGDDVDFSFLSRRLKLTGGHIQQIALHAAFAAAEVGDAIRMDHILQATREGLTKLGMLNAELGLVEQMPAQGSGYSEQS